MSNLPHHHLPSPFDRYASMVLLEEVEHADYYLLVNLGLLVLIAIFQLKMFARPPPVPLKKLPQRPALSILFKPDDITSISTLTDSHSVSSGTSRLNSNFSRTSSSFDVDPIIETVKEVLSSVPPPPAPRRFSASSGSAHSVDEDHIEMETPGKPSYDLPDSFAPLLSSSQTEMLLHQLTADLIHGIHAEASVRMREGRHEIPLDKDRSRPQFVVDIPKGGIRLSAVASVGSDRFSTAQDLNVAIPTTSRSQPMLKHAGLVFDPPLPLLNVAPTLIHFPTLFEDNTVVPKLRSIQIIRFFVDAVIAINSWIEKLLWIIESFLQIHLSKVRITPLYKGRSSLDDTSPEWRLTLAFSGHCLLCGVIPIPFISVILPTFIIPQPHALLEYLLSKQPLASARIRRENIAEQRIALAVLDTADSWNCKVEAVATPPAVGIDLTLTGGLSLGLELMHGRDPIAGRTRKDAGDASYLNHSKDTFPESLGGGAGNRGIPPPSSGASMSSWTTNDDSGSDLRRRASFPKASNTQPFDANNVVPWKFNFHAKGSINKEKMSFHLLNCSFQHEDASTSSQFQTRGSFAVWRAANDIKSEPSNLAKPYAIRRSASFAHRAALASANETPSVAEIFLFPDDTEAFHRDHSMLQYDYAFDISEDSKLDALTFSVGANHPMLNGGSMVTTILESIYAFGSVSARKHAVLDPMERKRKRNILRHLPAIDFTFGIQNSYIPPESHSYTDDGQARSLPAMEGGRIMVRFLGGIQEEKKEQEIILMPTGDIRMSESESPVAEGIKVVADVGFSSIVLNSETSMKEFPELEIFEGAKLRALTSGKLGGYIKCHLRPQKLASSLSTTGPNIFNPLEAYEIDFSGSSFSVRLKESSTSLGHRRIIMPAETTIKVKVVESIVDMAMEGMSECEFSWDFQGLSPILQVTEVGFSPEDVNHEKKEQVSLLIAPLRQGRLNFHVSPVGGINITKAATSREDKEGLYDWKFFNALVSSDQQSTERLVDVINDKRTMNKLLQVIKLINSDGHRVLNWILTQVWRAKDILDQEGISDPKHIIPGHRMARLVSLLLCGDLSQVVVILPIIRRVTTGDGLDVVAVKELLRQHCEFYEDWTPELDRAVRWVEVMFTPFTVPPPFVENHVVPLAEQPHHFSRFKAIPSAAQLYDHLHDRPHLPLDRSFSNLVGRVAPYLSFNQIEYFLKVRSSKDWQPSDLKRLRYVYSVKRKVMDIAESYGGLSFLPQSFLVSVFLGEATRASLRVTQRSSHQATEPGSGTRYGLRFSSRPSTLLSLRHRRARLQDPILGSVPEENPPLSAAARVASVSNFLNQFQPPAQNNTGPPFDIKEEDSSQYELGDCLLGPADVAALLQAGLASVMKGSSVVQLNQRMLLDLIASQPESFAIAVLAEIGTSGGQGGSPQQLTSALMALLELDQNSFRPVHRLDMQALLESWLPGLKVPRREDYMAGGRWARQSYYDALSSLARNILEDAECYSALKLHLQRVRHHKESDPIPKPREEQKTEDEYAFVDSGPTKLSEAIHIAREKIEFADQIGRKILIQLITDEKTVKSSRKHAEATEAYFEAFAACARVRDMDKLAFHSHWFKEFYKRNYDALIIKSMYDNVIDDVDNVRYWLHRLRRGAKFGAPRRDDKKLIEKYEKLPSGELLNPIENFFAGLQKDSKSSDEDDSMADSEQLKGADTMFLEPQKYTEQALVDAILDAAIFEKKERERLRKDPLVRLLISNPPGNYDFSIVTAMGVITEGKAGTELQDTFERIEKIRGVKTIRSDVATARSLEFNSGKIIEAIESARSLNVPYGLIGYSQGCANTLMAETLLNSGTPRQQQEISGSKGLVCRQLLFSAANASIHGPSSEKKVQRLIVMVEEFFKYQQGYVSRALQSAFLEIITNSLDSPQFHKMMGGVQSFLSEGCRSFWREGQHLAHVPTCTLRGVLEEHTTPEALEMLVNMLTKQSGSAMHDSQVHSYDAVGYPVYHRNRNGQILEKCDAGAAAIERTHHWSPLNKEVGFITTPRDCEIASFDCAKDRHVFPWVDVNVRFGFIKYSKKHEEEQGALAVHQEEAEEAEETE